MKTDITYCTGIECPYRSHCERWQGNHEDMESHIVSVFEEPPIVWNKDGTAYCELIMRRRDG